MTHADWLNTGQKKVTHLARSKKNRENIVQIKY